MKEPVQPSRDALFSICLCVAPEPTGDRRGKLGRVPFVGKVPDGSTRRWAVGRKGRHDLKVTPLAAPALIPMLFEATGSGCSRMFWWRPQGPGAG